MKVSLDFIKSIEKGRSCVILDNLELLCEILDRSPNYFFEDNSNALIEENLELYLKFKELDKENLKTLSKWLNALVEND